MHTRPSNREDELQAAARIVAQITGQPIPKAEIIKNPAAVALGRLGGSKGGKARAASLTIERRKEIAQIAAQSRWKKRE